MRKRFPLVCMLLVIMFLHGCVNGGASLTELSAMVVDAVKNNSESKLKKAMPTQKGMEQAMQDYFSNEYHDKMEMKAKATERMETNKRHLFKDLNVIYEKGKASGMDWKKVKMANFSFSEKDTKDGFHTAIATLYLSGDKPHKLEYDAVQYAGRWYLVGRMKMD